MSKRLAEVNRVKANIAQLATAFPNCFFVSGHQRRPLKLRIRTDLQPLVVFTAEELDAALRFYVRSDTYLQGCTEGGPRIDLAGAEVGSVTAAEAAHAQKLLEARAARNAERKTKCERLRLEEAARKAQQRVAATAPKRVTLADLRAAAAKRRAATGT
jgi:ProP effector